MIDSTGPAVHVVSTGACDCGTKAASIDPAR